jgi:hypothetical protein
MILLYEYTIILHINHWSTNRKKHYTSTEIRMLVAKLKHTICSTFHRFLLPPPSVRTTGIPTSVTELCERHSLQSTQPCTPPPAPKIYFDNILPSSKTAIPLNLSKTKYHTFQSLCTPWFTPIITYQKYKIWSYLLCHCIHFSGPNILFDSSFSQPSNCITRSQ